MKLAHFGLVALLALALAGCGTTRKGGREAGVGAQVGHYKLGKPYRIKGRWYRPEFDPGYDRVGTASWYGQDFHGLPTANGEVFDKNRITAAHPTLPLPSLVRVTNLENGRSLELRVNDRGPFINNRLIDLSQAAARKLGFEGQGLADVRVQFLKLADATGTPPAPTVVARATPVRATARASAPRPAQPPRPRAIQVAALAEPVPAPSRFCPTGARFVQVGAFAETDTMRAALATVGGLDQVRVEPTFVGRRALARLRLGPVGSDAEAAVLLHRVKALGYTSAFLTTAGGSGASSC
jgi:rare lipoprotein A